MIAGFRSLWDKLVRAWNKRAEATLWKRREANAMAILKDSWSFAKPNLDAVRSYLSLQLNTNETAESRLARIKQDTAIYKINTLVFKSLLELKRFISVQPLSAPVGSIYWMATVATNEADSKVKKLEFKVIKEHIQARTVKLHNVNMLTADSVDDSDVLEAFADEVAAYIIRDVLLMSTEGSSTEVRSYEKSTLESALGGDYLTSAIMRLSNQIAKKSRRGLANWVIAAPDVCSTLQGAKVFEGEAHLESEIVKLRGKLQGISVYEFSSLPEGHAIIGVKGPVAVDAGAVFSPLVPLMLAPPSYDPSTYQTILPCMSRFGFKHLGKNVTDIDNVPVVDGKDYYATLKVEVKGGRSPNA